MSLPRPLSNLLRFLTAWRADARSRRALMSLDDRILRDIGITRAEAERAAAQPYWRRSRPWLRGGLLERRRARTVARHIPKC
jgi:uncharacterized protein YjiS (DUF1127 family)